MPLSGQNCTGLARALWFREVLDEHLHWAIAQQKAKREEKTLKIQTSQQKRLVRAITKGLPRDA